MNLFGPPTMRIGGGYPTYPSMQKAIIKIFCIVGKSLNSNIDWSATQPEDDTTVSSFLSQ